MKGAITSWLDRHRYFKSTIQFILVAVPFGFIINSLVGNWAQIESYQLDVSLLKMGLSGVFLFSSFAMLPLATKTVFRILGHNLPFFSVYINYFISQLSKYLPGGIWIVPSRILFFSQFRITTADISLGLGIELAFLIIAGIINFFPYYLVNRDVFGGNLGFVLGVPILIGLVGALIFIRFGCGSRIGNGPWFHKIKSNNLKGRLLFLLCVDLMFWLFIGVGLYFLASGFTLLTLNKFFVLSSAFSLAWVVGFFAFLTPSGLGVREGVLMLLIAPYFPEPVPAIISIVARVWWSFGDFTSALLALVYRKRVFVDYE